MNVEVDGALNCDGLASAETMDMLELNKNQSKRDSENYNRI